MFFQRVVDSGFADQIGCATCGGNMSVICRKPHPELGYELQTLGCFECSELTARSVDIKRPRAAKLYTGL
jgi:hypothetical protein